MTARIVASFSDGPTAAAPQSACAAVGLRRVRSPYFDGLPRILVIDPTAPDRTAGRT